MFRDTSYFPAAARPHGKALLRTLGRPAAAAAGRPPPIPVAPAVPAPQAQTDAPLVFPRLAA